MVKFASTANRPRPRSPLKTKPAIGSTTRRPGYLYPWPTQTHEGAPAWEHDDQTALVLGAASYFVGEDTFYESAEDRAQRFIDLIRKTVASDPDFVARFAPYLRNELKIRSASIMLAAEYVAAGGPNGRKVVNSVCQRPDEPAEMLGYWMGKYGRSIPAAVKRGVADAATRLYNERNALKWDSANRSITMADVIRLTHPRPKVPWQNALFKYLIANHPVTQPPMFEAWARLQAIPEDERRTKLCGAGLETLGQAGMTWERLSSWLPGGMDAEAWSWAIPHMGAFALIRNLRNFTEAGIFNEPAYTSTARTVLNLIADPKEIAKARIFPVPNLHRLRDVA